MKTGDVLAEVETDKATMELESFFDGTLLAVFVPAGSQVPLGAAALRGRQGRREGGRPAAQRPRACACGRSLEGVRTSSRSCRPRARACACIGSSPRAPRRRRPSRLRPPPLRPPAHESRFRPLARKLAAEKGHRSRRASPEAGPGGRIVRADVLAAPAPGSGKAAKAAGSQAAPSIGASLSAKGPVQEDKVVQVSNIRATIARRLVESKTQIPHFYLDIEVDAGPLLELRSQLNSALEKEGVKLSVNDFVLKACAEALRKVPAVNCSWEETAIRHHPAAHVSFAVAIEDGLITPVVRDAHLKSIFAISSEAKALGKRAREKKLAPAEFTGGTFCVSNLGMMGIDRFSAIINLPERGDPRRRHHGEEAGGER